ncbi:MAG TPA: phytanoyl-CoA dioxygenase family protein [Abditibacteriaceae bacterium]|nr:phytanoyl-CoA dioxygenase family protein [Abditibacteriaceae bacterium]
MSQAEIALPELSNEYSIAPSDIQTYNRDGHILLRSVATPQEIAVYGPLIEDATDRYKGEILPLEERDTYGKAFWQITNLWQRDEAVRRFTLARRFAKIAADLMGVEGVRLYHDQALFKEPGGGPTPWHQDQFYWPLDTDKTITLWMPLVDASPAMGTLRFASGSQQEGYLGAIPISDESNAVFEKFVREKGFQVTQPQQMNAGDASFHSGWTLHSAPGNNSDTMRSVMTIIYFADGARATKPDHANREEDLRIWLPGIQPGELAASELNPLLYSR